MSREEYGDKMSHTGWMTHPEGEREVGYGEVEANDNEN